MKNAKHFRQVSPGLSVWFRRTASFPTMMKAPCSLPRAVLTSSALTSCCTATPTTLPNPTLSFKLSETSNLRRGSDDCCNCI